MHLTTAEWIKRLNALGREIDEIAASIHPSAWEEQLAALHGQYLKLAAMDTRDPLVQLELFEKDETNA